MTEEKLKEIEDAYKASTQGEWSAVSSLPRWAVSSSNENHRFDVVTASGREYASREHNYHGSNKEDACFIALAHNAMPELIEAVRDENEFMAEFERRIERDIKSRDKEIANLKTDLQDLVVSEGKLIAALKKISENFPDPSVCSEELARAALEAK